VLNPLLFIYKTVGSNLMKNIFYILTLVLPTFCVSQELSIQIDTLKISDNGRLTETAFYKDNFYFLFQTDRKNTTADFKTMKVYDLKGKFVENVFLPKSAISMPYCDLRVNNERLYLKQEHSFKEKTFLLEKYVADFNEIQDTVVNVYEDLNYRIHPNCNGEWGASTYFENKTNNNVYEFSSSCNFNFEKTNQGYLLTNRNEILIIRNPEKLYKSQITFDRSYLNKQNQGIETFFKSDFDLYTTFSKNNELTVVYGDSSNSHIGKLKNGELKSIYDFGQPFRFSYWFKDNNSNTQILEMYTYESESDFGFLEGYKMLGLLLIRNGEFKMYYIK
jgi:hypothetical protein